MTAEVFNKVFETFKAVTTCNGQLDSIDTIRENLDILCREQEVDNRYKSFFSSILSLLGDIAFNKANAIDMIKKKNSFGDAISVETRVSSIIECYSDVDFAEIILYANVQSLKGDIIISDFYAFLMNVYNLIQSEFVLVMALYAVVQEKVNNYNYDYILRVLQKQFTVKHFQILLIIKAMDETMTKSFVAYSGQIMLDAFEKAFNSIIDKSGI